MVGTPTTLATGEEHLGRRKPDGALALEEARARKEEWQEIVRAAQARLARVTSAPAPEIAAGVSREPRIAFIGEGLAIRSKALLLAAPRDPSGRARSRTLDRICTSL